MYACVECKQKPRNGPPRKICNTNHICAPFAPPHSIHSRRPAMRPLFTVSGHLAASSRWRPPPNQRCRPRRRQPVRRRQQRQRRAATGAHRWSSRWPALATPSGWATCGASRTWSTGMAAVNLHKFIFVGWKRAWACALAKPPHQHSGTRRTYWAKCVRRGEGNRFSFKTYDNSNFFTWTLVFCYMLFLYAFAKKFFYWKRET